MSAPTSSNSLTILRWLNRQAPCKAVYPRVEWKPSTIGLSPERYFSTCWISPEQHASIKLSRVGEDSSCSMYQAVNYNNVQTLLPQGYIPVTKRIYKILLFVIIFYCLILFIYLLFINEKNKIYKKRTEIPT